MSKTTNRTRAFIYDVFAKCEANENFSFGKLIRHHQIGWVAYEALKKSGRVYMTKPYKWVGNAPNENVVSEIENLRMKIQKQQNDKYLKGINVEENQIDTTQKNQTLQDLIDQNAKLIEYIKKLQ